MCVDLTLSPGREVQLADMALQLILNLQVLTGIS